MEAMVAAGLAAMVAGIAVAAKTAFERHASEVAGVTSGTAPQGHAA